ncbi:MAG TPA: ABC transporter ATP-binding protein [Bacteroidia bacterium]|jgi:ATP-binding cassette subfamily B protein|nr:ABC transporter ATP-binding protein [Bacteroidia bacterium]HRG51574.1 ABC transporter ATP-binding protein [Bacteroidia bacterium]
MSKQKKKKVSGKAVDFIILKRIFTYVKPYKGNFIFAAITTISLSLIAPARPYLVKYTIDKHVANFNATMLGYMTMVLIGLLMLEAIVQFADGYLTNRLGQYIIKDMRVQLYKHILNLRLKYYDNSPIGTLVTRAVSDMEVIGDIFSEGLIVIIGDILKLLVILSLMLLFNVKLTLISLISIPILLFATYLFKRSVSASFQDVRTQVARLNAFVQEHITGINIVQIFNREQAEFEKFDEINKKHRDANIRSIMAYSIFFPVVEILSSVSIGLLIWWGGKGLLAGVTTKGELVQFIMYLNMLFRPIRQLADRFNTLQMGMVSSDRVFKVLDTREFISTEGTKTAENIEGRIEFKDVWFAYLSDEVLTTASVVASAKTEGSSTASDTTPWVLKGISFSVEKGQTVALVGATGAGKSSIINLLNRFYEYNKGVISIDGIDVRDYELGSLRKNIGVVLQDVFLFSDTLANNIALNNPNISREQIMEAAKIVGAHDFITALPNGYDYNAMERGGMLSVGQRQLISFIRAYVYNPKILILDEATSSIDTASERLIQQATDILTKDRTSIIIAHRLATIQKADKIIVMDKGKIVEMGNHQELLKMNGQYKRLFDLQFKEEVLEK